jgi:predicted Zn-dependent protease
MRFGIIIAALLALGACVPATRSPTVTTPPSDITTAEAQRAVQTFIEVVQRMEPVAEDICRRDRPGANCDFEIYVDRDPASGVNAFQTVDRWNRPVIIFTVGLIAEARNADEIAFVMGHEAAHHIAGHLDARRVQADAGAVIFGEIARAGGASPDLVGEAARIGSVVASRRFTQAAELEADALGAVIAHQSGYDPLNGAQFFSRLPDPTHRFLSTHPPNALRLSTVRRTMAEIEGGGV